MRYLVFGDVHANLAALDAVLSAADRLGVDAYLCVGDLVGYGPEPLECLERLWQLYRAERLAWVAGNHDLVARGTMEPDGFGPEAVETLRWTRDVVNKQAWAREFLATGQLFAKVEGGIWLTHDSLAAPGSGHYHRTTQNADRELQELARHAGRVCFYGHTHTQRAEVLSGSAAMLAPMKPAGTEARDPSPLRLGPDERAWVGTGSAGFPTAKKGAAEFVIWHEAEQTVEKYTVAFSREEARERVRTVLGPVCSAAVTERIIRWL